MSLVLLTAGTSLNLWWDLSLHHRTLPISALMGSFLYMISEKYHKVRRRKGQPLQRYFRIKAMSALPMRNGSPCLDTEDSGRKSGNNGDTHYDKSAKGCHR